MSPIQLYTRGQTIMGKPPQINLHFSRSFNRPKSLPSQVFLLVDRVNTTASLASLHIELVMTGKMVGRTYGVISKLCKGPRNKIFANPLTDR
jgi:hypothetical protein